MAKKFTPGGQAGRRGKKKGGTGSRIFLAAVTFCNLLLSLILALLRRQEVIHAVQENEDVKVLLTARKKTGEPK